MKRKIKIIAIFSLMAFLYTFSGCDDATDNTQNINNDTKQEQQIVADINTDNTKNDNTSETGTDSTINTDDIDNTITVDNTDNAINKELDFTDFTHEIQVPNFSDDVFNSENINSKNTEDASEMAEEELNKDNPDYQKWKEQQDFLNLTFAEQLQQMNIEVKPANDIIQPENYILPQNYEAYVETETENKIIELVNEFRTENGLNELQKSDYLTNTAEYKSVAMIQYDYIAHNNPWMTNKEYYENLIFAFGKEVKASENIASTEAGAILGIADINAERIFNIWKNSEPHKKNMLGKDWNYVGVGVAMAKKEGIYEFKATQHFSADV